jgi:hypothetical protein
MADGFLLMLRDGYDTQLGLGILPSSLPIVTKLIKMNLPIKALW